MDIKDLDGTEQNSLSSTQLQFYAPGRRMAYVPNCKRAINEDARVTTANGVTTATTEPVKNNSDIIFDGRTAGE